MKCNRNNGEECHLELKYITKASGVRAFFCTTVSHQLWKYDFPKEIVTTYTYEDGTTHTTQHPRRSNASA